MKKNVFEQVVNLVNGKTVEDMEALRAEINDEWNAMQAKASAKQDAYAAAKPIVLGVMDSTPRTVKEIFALCEETLPCGFSAAKIQYAFLHYWQDEIVKHDNGKSANTYSRG